MTLGGAAWPRSVGRTSLDQRRRALVAAAATARRRRLCAGDRGADSARLGNMVLALSGHARAGVRLARSVNAWARLLAGAHGAPACTITGSRRHVCTGTGLALPALGAGLGSPLSHQHGDWTGLTLPKSTPGMRSPLAHLRRNLGMWASAADDRAAFARFLRGFGVHVPCALGRAAPTLRPCRSRGAHVSHVGFASSLVLCNTRGVMRARHRESHRAAAPMARGPPQAVSKSAAARSRT